MFVWGNSPIFFSWPLKSSHLVFDFNQSEEFHWILSNLVQLLGQKMVQLTEIRSAKDQFHLALI